MPVTIENLHLGLDEDLQEKLTLMVGEVADHRVLKQSVDARRGRAPQFILSVEVAKKGEVLPPHRHIVTPLTPQNREFEKPIVIGTGPAGLFCALRLAERGLPCTILERGSAAEKRIMGINRFWRYGELNPDNNVCIGEGGAGLYSDGKLITRIKSPHIPYVLNRMVKYGAPGEIEYLANPHVGSDKIRRIIPRLRQHLLELGCEIHFNTAFSELLTSDSQVRGVRTRCGREFFSSRVIVATGHSAEDVLQHFANVGVKMEGKSFAMGLRIEHPQALINSIQYREWADHPKLKAANYKLTHHDHQTGVGVYSFCMCPGGFVLSSGTEADGLVVNGMSNYHRNSPFANSAIVVTMDHDKLFGSNLFGGLQMRRELEQRAYQAVKMAGGTKQLPTQRLTDFIEGRASRTLLATSSPSGILPARLDQLLPQNLLTPLREGLLNFPRKMKGFLTEDAQLYGVESRTSCPVRVTRHEVTLQSLSHPGLYPAGEGAGYAGGITSAACDGVQIAERIFQEHL